MCVPIPPPAWEGSANHPGIASIWPIMWAMPRIALRPTGRYWPKGSACPRRPGGSIRCMATPLSMPIVRPRARGVGVHRGTQVSQKGPTMSARYSPPIACRYYFAIAGVAVPARPMPAGAGSPAECSNPRSGRWIHSPRICWPGSDLVSDRRRSRSAMKCARSLSGPMGRRVRRFPPRGMAIGARISTGLPDSAWRRWAYGRSMGAVFAPGATGNVSFPIAARESPGAWRASSILPMAHAPGREQDDSIENNAVHGLFPMGATKRRGITKYNEERDLDPRRTQRGRAATGDRGPLGIAIDIATRYRKSRIRSIANRDIDNEPVPYGT